MDEDFHSCDYDDYYCEDVAYDVYDRVYADIQFEPYFNSNSGPDFYTHADIEIEGADNGGNISGSEEVDVYIEGGDGGDRHQSDFGLGGYDGNVYEDIQIDGPGTLDWDIQGDEDEYDDDDHVEDELIRDEDVDENDSLSLSRLMRDGIRAVIEQLEPSFLDQFENAVVEKLESWLFSLNWTMPTVKFWPFFRGVRSSSSGTDNGNREEEVEIDIVDKGKELFQSQNGTLSCPICMELCTTDAEHSACSLPCGHLYGMSCIKRWLHRQNPGKCPQCKMLCKLEDVRRLYGSFTVVDKHLEEKIRVLEAKCASLELKDSEWEKKEAEWRKKEAELSRLLPVNEKKVADLLDVAEAHA